MLALSKRNSNAAEIILFLHRIVQVLIEYFKELEEESIRDNFVIIYELLDEMMDFGFPQTTESKILQECVCDWNGRVLGSTDGSNRYITQESYKLEVQVRPPIAVTNAVSWRSEGIRYRKNEVFLDVIESVNLLVRIPALEIVTQLMSPTGQREWKRRALRDPRRREDEVLPLGHARVAARAERQGHVREHGEE